MVGITDINAILCLKMKACWNVEKWREVTRQFIDGTSGNKKGIKRINDCLAVHTLSPRLLKSYELFCLVLHAVLFSCHQHSTKEIHNSCTVIWMLIPTKHAEVCVIPARYLGNFSIKTPLRGKLCLYSEKTIGVRSLAQRRIGNGSEEHSTAEKSWVVKKQLALSEALILEILWNCLGYISKLICGLFWTNLWKH